MSDSENRSLWCTISLDISIINVLQGEAGLCLSFEVWLTNLT